ncbi:response regulator transcription factor [Pseudoclavibacter helvolus]|uniref:response regulator transcription factor n=1 Tax=Pseudoclavibacter helvolus TaxID=255205 RepID=UPI0008393A2D|nr:response regulator transcription factor [Pseudoclavibacter helvolus]
MPDTTRPDDESAPESQLAEVLAQAKCDALLAPKVTRTLIEAFAQAPAKRSVSPTRFNDLTEREREVFELVAKGHSNSEISKALFIAEQTTKSHVSRIMAKLHLRDRVHAVVLGYESGLITPGETQQQ